MEQWSCGTVADIHVGRGWSTTKVPPEKLAYTELRPANFVSSGLGVSRRSCCRVLIRVGNAGRDGFDTEPTGGRGGRGDRRFGVDEEERIRIYV